jgi:hypothetical protein
MNLRVIAYIASVTISLVLIGPANAVGENGDIGFEPHCSNASLDGHFGFYRAGSTPVGTLASIGLIRYDGHGNFVVNQNISKNGAYQFDIEFNGTYQVNADCTGAAFLDGAEFARIVVTERGHSFYMFSESAGNAVYGVGQRVD